MKIKKTKLFKKSLVFFTFLLIAVLVFGFIPSGTIFGDTSPFKIENSDPITTYTAPAGGIITGVKIHAGYGQTYSGILGNGTYGHIVIDINGQPNESNLIAAYVPDGSTTPPGTFVGPGYTVAGVGTNSATVTRTSDANWFHGISWVEFYFTCSTPETKSITVTKTLTTGSSGTFNFTIAEDGGTWTDTKPIIYTGGTPTPSSIVWTGLDVTKTYTITEASNADYDFDNPSTGVAGGIIPDNQTIDFKNKLKTKSITVTKTLTTGSSGTFNFTIAEDGGTWTDTKPIIYTGGTPTPSSIVWTGLDVTKTYTITEASNADYDFDNPSTGVAGGIIPDNQTIDFKNKLKTKSITVTKTLTTGSSGTFNFTIAEDGGTWTDTKPIIYTGGTPTPSSIVWTGLDVTKTYTITEASNADYDFDNPSTGVAGGIIPDNQTIDFKNKLKTKSITVTKTLTTGSSGTFNFTIAEDGGTWTDTKPIIYTGGTPTPSSIVWTGLDVTKTYTITEASNADYDFDNPSTGVAGGIIPDNQTIDFKNKLKTKSITVTKTLTTGSSGTFNFTIAEDGGTWTDTKPIIYTGGTPTPSSIVWTGLDVTKTYTITEASNADYDFDNPSTGVAGGIIPDNQTIDFKNKLKTFRVGSITVIKRDITDDSVLAGAVFGLFTDEAGTTGALDADGNPVGNQTSGADGKAVFINLRPNTYWVKELTPPTGYGLSGAIKVILGLPGSSSGELSTFAALTYIGPVVNPLDVTIDYRNPRLDGFLRIRKTDSVTGLPVPGATYVVLAGSSTGPVLYRAVTGPDGTITMTGFVWGTPYYVKEEAAPAGYILDPNTYGPAIFSATVLSYTFTVTNDPTGGGGGTLTVAGITEGIQVLAFTGIDPFIPIAGGSALIAGMAMLVVTLKRRNKYLAKRVSQKVDE